MQAGRHAGARRAGTAVFGVGVIVASLLPAQAAMAAAGETTTVTLERSTYTVPEGGRVDVGVRVTTSDGGALTGPVSVDYGTGQGSATAGADYTPTAGTFRSEEHTSELQSR